MLHEKIEDFVNTGFSVFLFKQVHESGQQYADMAELADALDLGSSGYPRAGSSPVIRSLESCSFAETARFF